MAGRGGGIASVCGRFASVMRKNFREILLLCHRPFMKSAQLKSLGRRRFDGL